MMVAEIKREWVHVTSKNVSDTMSLPDKVGGSQLPRRFASSYLAGLAKSVNQVTNRSCAAAADHAETDTILSRVSVFSPDHLYATRQPFFATL
jgi:hypothetical protein